MEEKMKKQTIIPLILILIVMFVTLISGSGTYYVQRVGTLSTNDNNDKLVGVCFFVNSSIAEDIYITSINRTNGATANYFVVMTNCTKNTVAPPNTCVIQANGTSLTNNQFTLDTPLLLNKSLYYCVGVDNVTGGTHKRYYSDLGGNVVGSIVTYNDSFYDDGYSNNYYYLSVEAITFFVGSFDSTDYTPVFVSQSPSDINVLNVLDTGYVNITYNHSDISSNGTYFINYSFINNTNTINGTIETNSYTEEYTDNSSSQLYRYVLGDNQVYPAVYNVNETLMDTTNHSYYTVSGNNIYKTQFIGINTSKTYNFFEAYVTVNGSGLLYYCNSSYTTGIPLMNSNCALISTFNFTGFNHTHSYLGFNYSKHNVFSLPVVSGKINNITFTSTAYLLFRAVPSSTLTIGYINGSPRTNTTMLSTNNGLSYTDQDTVIDAHIHQYGDYDGLRYNACNYNTSGSLWCSTTTSDYYGLIPLPPTGTTVTTNQSNYYLEEYINVSWTNVTPVLGYITSHVVKLIDSYGVTYSNTTQTNTTFNTNINTTNTKPGSYYVQVYSVDNNSLSSYGLSDSFTITSTLYEPCNDTITLNNSDVTVLFNWSTNTNITSDELCLNYSAIENCYNQGLQTFNNTTLTLSYKLIFLQDDYRYDSECYLEFCINQWSRTTQPCTDNLRLVTYTDNNTCPETYGVPGNNGTYEDCVSPPNTDKDLWFIIFLFVIWLVLLVIGFRYPISFLGALITSVFLMILTITYFTDTSIIYFITFPVLTVILGSFVTMTRT